MTIKLDMLGCSWNNCFQVELACNYGAASQQASINTESIGNSINHSMKLNLGSRLQNSILLLGLLQEKITNIKLTN